LSSRGHRRTGSRHRSEANSRAISEETTRVALTRATKTAAVPSFRDEYEPRSRRLPSCRERASVNSTVDASVRFLWECAAAPHTVVTSERRSVRQHVLRRLLGERLVLTCLAASQAPWRAVRRTDFCLLTSSYEYPRLVGSRRLRALSRPCFGESPDSRESGSLLRTPRALRFVA